MTRRTLQIIRWGVFTLACAFLVIRLGGSAGSPPPWTAWWNGNVEVPWWTLGIVSGLMLVNWGLEAWKWQWLMRPVGSLSFGRSYLATIAGTSIGLITPNRVGEFAGRVLFLAPENRVAGGFATLLGSIAQFVVTLLVGGVSLFFGSYLLAGGGSSSFSWTVVIWSSLLIGCAAVFLYFSPGAFARLLLAIPFLRRYERHAHVLDTFDAAQLTRVFALSLLRYGVFTVQFCLMLAAVAGVRFPDALASVPVVFLVTTLVPTTVLTELGIRGSVAAAIVPGPEAAIVVSSALLWLINIVVPAVVGSFVLLLARIRLAKDRT